MKRNLQRKCNKLHYKPNVESLGNGRGASQLLVELLDLGLLTGCVVLCLRHSLVLSQLGNLIQKAKKKFEPGMPLKRQDSSTRTINKSEVVASGDREKHLLRMNGR